MRYLLEKYAGKAYVETADMWAQKPSQKLGEVKRSILA